MVVFEQLNQVFILDAKECLTLLHGLKDRKSNYTKNRENTSTCLHKSYGLLINKNWAHKAKKCRALTYCCDNSNILTRLGSFIIGWKDHEISQKIEHAAYVRQAFCCRVNVILRRLWLGFVQDSNLIHHKVNPNEETIRHLARQRIFWVYSCCVVKYPEKKHRAKGKL